MVRDTVEVGIPLAPALSQGRGLTVVAAVVAHRRALGRIHLVVSNHPMVTEAETKVNKSMSLFT